MRDFFNFRRVHSLRAPSGQFESRFDHVRREIVERKTVQECLELGRNEAVEQSRRVAEVVYMEG